MVEIGHLESAIWAIADGRGTDADRALLQEGGAAAQAALARLIAETEEDLAGVRGLHGEERDQVVADFTESLNGLLDLAEELLPSHARRPDEPLVAAAAPEDLRPPDEVALQASWVAGQIVVWAAARGAAPESNAELASRLEAAGGPPHGWEVHPGVALPNGQKAEALAIHLKDALGWLVALSGEREPVGLGASLLWLSRVALEGVRLAASGSIVPKLDVATRADGRSADARVRWVPALTDTKRIEPLVLSMPRSVTVLNNDGSRNTAMAVMIGVIETIVTQSVERLDLPAQPPRAASPTDLVDTIVARMDGVAFPADRGLAKEMARRIEQWTKAVADPRHQPLVVRLDPPATQGVWMLSVQVRADANKLVPVATAMRADTGRTIATEWARLEKMFPPLRRADPAQRGQVALGQDEAWEFMSGTGAMLASIGFDVRAPQLSPRPARPALHMFTEVRAGSTVGANQLSDVRWSVVFDDVELTAAEIARLAKQARPMVQSRGAWVEIDRLDLERAAEALAERENVTQLTGAEILRQSMGIDAGLGGAVVVHGDSWAKDIVSRAQESQAALDATPERFNGTLRSYQAEALAWIGFLEASDLGGCLALDMGLGKTPTVLAHLARNGGKGTSLVIAPAAVVGNWAAEAARFAPDLRVLVHHGASRASDAQLEKEISEADLIITTYATAVRDVEALANIEWRTMVLDEAQAIKNPASDTAQQLRRLRARTKLCLTGTPIENGVGDLWAILDFTNPGLVGPRPVFVAQMSGDGESALRALNGVLLFRRTKAEPEVAAELPDKIDELDHCTMTPEQIGLYQAVLDELLAKAADPAVDVGKGAVLAAITALKQICNHPAAYHDDGLPLGGRSGKLTRLEEIVDSVFAAGERILIFTHFATWGRRLATHLSEVFGHRIECYDGDLSRTARDRMVADFQGGEGAGAMVLSLKAGGTGLNLTAANHVILYDRWWNPAIEDQARDRAWRLGQTRTVISHRLVCPGTIDERVEEVVQGKRHVAGMVLPKSSSIADLDVAQLSLAFGLRPDELLTDESVSEDER